MRKILNYIGAIIIFGFTAWVLWNAFSGYVDTLHSSPYNERYIEEIDVGLPLGH